MSDTPRTDEELLILCTDPWSGGSGWMDSYGAGSAPKGEQYVSADFARELERELAELKRENARIQMELDASCNAEELRQVRAENARLRGLVSEVIENALRSL